MNPNNIRKDYTTSMQIQRDYIPMLKQTIENLQELRCQLHLDGRQILEIEASIKRTERLLREQHNFVNDLEKKVLTNDFVKFNGKKYTGKEKSLTPQLIFDFLD